MKKVAFICIHNSCRSQMAEAITKIVAKDDLEAYSAGTEKKSSINPLAVKAIKELYNVDISLTQYPKLIEELPPVDVVITMGCGVQCPFLPCEYREDWGLVDPTGKDYGEYIKTAKIIEQKIKQLIIKLKNQ
jgi:arsenate reductase